MILPPQNKTTKYEHNSSAGSSRGKAIKGLLVVLNTVGGDVGPFGHC